MPIDVWFVMLPGVLSLDMTGPAETFVLAGDAFRLHYIGPQPDVPTSIGLTMSGIQPLPERLPEGSLLVLPGVSDSRAQFPTPQALRIQHWLMRLQPIIQRRDITVMCVCSGALLAAKSGLLNNRQCTTHHDVSVVYAPQPPQRRLKKTASLCRMRTSGPARGSRLASIWRCI